MVTACLLSLFLSTVTLELTIQCPAYTITWRVSLITSGLFHSKNLNSVLCRCRSPAGQWDGILQRVTLPVCVYINGQYLVYSIDNVIIGYLVTCTEQYAHFVIRYINQP